MTTIERKILKNLGVESLGLYTSRETAKTVVSVHLLEGKAEWETKEIEKYILSLLPNVTFL